MMLQCCSSVYIVGLMLDQRRRRWSQLKQDWIDVSCLLKQ